MLSFAQSVYARPDAPQVISMSWGWPENGQCESGIGSCTDPEQYVQRCNTEFAKIVGRGITLVSSSGDQGAPGDNHPNCGGLSDLFPTSSPWVLSVGATMLGNNQNNTVTNFASPVTAPVCKQRSVSCARGDVLTEEVCTFRSNV
jgi:subtilase family serine protease